MKIKEVGEILGGAQLALERGCPSPAGPLQDEQLGQGVPALHLRDQLILQVAIVIAAQLLIPPARRAALLM